MRAFEIVENQSPTNDMLLKLRKGMAASLNAGKLQTVFAVLNANSNGGQWTIEKSKSYKLSDGGWVISEVGNGTAKQFNSSFMNRDNGRIVCSTAMPRALDQYNASAGEVRQRQYQEEAQRNVTELRTMGENLQAIQNAPEKGKWFVRNVDMREQQNPRYPQLSELVVSFDLYVLTSGFTITSPDGQTYEVYGDYKNGAISPQTFASWFAWAAEHTEIMDQILEVLGMEPHEKKHNPKSRYTPPPGAPAEEKRIFEVLKNLTDEVRDQQKDRLVTAWKRAVMTFVDLLNGDQENRKQAKAMAGGRHGFILSQCVDIRNKTFNDDWEKTVERIATEQVEDMQNVFVYKNTRKLASIGTAKGGMLEPKVIRVDVDGGDIVASLEFKFEDGSSFRVNQSVVFSTSVRGTPFYRFPTTFHDVVLSDGQKMAQPSEERMNEIFTKA